MRLLSLLVATLAAGALAVYVLTCSVNNTPPAPVHPIVGKWVQVVQNGQPVVPGRGMVIEYRADGVVVFQTTEGEGVCSQESGHYTVSDDTVQFRIPSRTSYLAGPPEFTVNFVLLGEDRYGVFDKADRGSGEYMRVRK